MKFKAMYKSQLAKKAEIPIRTFRHYLNVLYYEELKKLADYNRNQKILTPKQVAIIRDILVIVE